MNKPAVVSPEILHQRSLQRGLIYRAARHFLGPFVSRIRRKMDARKWAHHADPRSLDWDWHAVNFNRVAVVNLLLNKYSDPAYLEIGCASNSLFDSVPVPRKVGVDPSAGGTVRKTSDAFFEGNREKFDVIFIDGLHTYEQVRKDVVNALACLNPGGWIALHDMLPRNWLEHHVPMIASGPWTGDVWKVAFELAQTEGIEFKLLRIDHGVGVVHVTGQCVSLKDMRAELEPQQFSYYFDHLRELPITEWGDAQSWLRA